eukprot:GHRQ01017795.1.p2 GENE.GHRQ01017795.1~~GHRQ01017795.1.p2  ORF type:complete len:115 (-),score=17.65 GHRQ01017795.1:189-533(-)
MPRDVEARQPFGRFFFKAKTVPDRVVKFPPGEQLHAAEKSYAGNRTTTTKYSLLTFIPKSLFEQYRWGQDPCTPQLDSIEGTIEGTTELHWSHLLWCAAGVLRTYTSRWWQRCR